MFPSYTPWRHQQISGFVLSRESLIIISQSLIRSHLDFRDINY